MTAPDYLVLARRYRPTTFAEVVGQETVTRTLSNAVMGGRVAQAYLFAGPRGVGKTSVARVLAKSLNCSAGPTVTPCGTCDNCRAIGVGNDTDVIEIDGASNRSIDDIRELRERVRFAAGHSRHKIYIIDEVHMLTTEAFNALLKTLEEPPAHVVFVFATTRLDKVPTTIVSRCQRFVFRRIATSAITAKLLNISREEGITAEERALALIARRAGGSMRDAESLFDQVIAFSRDEITVKDVEQTLGLVGAEAVEGLAAAVLSGDGAAALRAVDRLASEGADLAQAAHQLVEYLRDLMILTAAPEATELLDVSGDELERRRALAGQHSASTLLNLVNVFLDAGGPWARVFSPRLVLEFATLKAVKIRQILPLEDLLEAGGGAGAADAAGGNTAVASPAAAAATPAAGTKSLTETWNRILEHLASADRPLYALVARARLASLAEGELHLGFPPSHRASAERVGAQRRRAALEEAARAVLGEDYTIKIEVEEGPAEGTAPESSLFGDMPLVAEIQKRYGGEVVEEKEVPPPEGEAT